MLIFDQLKKSDRPLRILSGIILLCMVLLAALLWYIQIATSKKYVKSLQIQSYRTVPVASIRGKILDKNGTPLADSRPSYNIVLTLEDIRESFHEQYRRLRSLKRRNADAFNGESLGPLARYLAVSNIVSELSGIIQRPLTLDREEFHRHYTQKPALPVTLAEDLSFKELALFKEYPQKPAGVSLQIQPMRVYPFNAFAAHSIGYVRVQKNPEPSDLTDFNYALTELRGVSGIEGAFNDVLHGRPGAKSILVNNLGYRQSESTWMESIPGKNIYLTIDARIQKTAEEALASVAGNIKGAVVVMDPRNGDLLAVVSMPEFDPGIFTPTLSSKEWEELNDPDRRPAFNRATAGAYAPGSIYKIIVSLAGLDSGAIDPDENFENPGFIRVGRRTISDTAPPGIYDFRRAFKLSSNTYFIHFGLETGLDKLIEISSQLLLGRRTGIPVMQESSGNLPTPKWKNNTYGLPWTNGDTANLCIGQGPITVTPLQMAVMTSAIANGGKVFAPRIVQRVSKQGFPSQPPAELKPGELRGTLDVNPGAYSIIRRAMLADVEDSDGTGRHAAVDGMRICGKTGTAQVKRGGRLVRYDTWFVSFAPLESPRYVVVVLVEGGASGGTTCAPVAGRIYEEILKIESGTQAPIEPYYVRK